MKTIQVAEATELQLDWLVAKCEGAQGIRFDGEFWRVHFGGAEEYLGNLDFSTNPAQGQPILERERIGTYFYELPTEGWAASIFDKPNYLGPTMLIAGLRAYVASKLGDEVEVPEELT